MPKRITATADNGEVFTRKTARTYTHACYLEFTYSNDTVLNRNVSWAGRPDLAEKNLAKDRKSAADLQGTEVSDWDPEKGCFVGTGIFREKVRAVAVPVND